MFWNARYDKVSGTKGTWYPHNSLLVSKEVNEVGTLQVANKREKIK